MITVNMHEAKTRLSRLVAAAEEGEEVVICRRGRPSARLVAVPSKPVKRILAPAARLRPKLAPGYDPAEPLSADEWPLESR